ncbi:MAG: nucleoside 2-deoxyribosyltransferase [Parcubacteria group bacterium]
MNIFLSVSVNAGRQYLPTYQHIADYLTGHGHTILDEQVVLDDMSKMETGKSHQWIHDKAKRDIKACDIFIAEITNPSTGVGVEIGYSVMLGKPTYALYLKEMEDAVSIMVSGNGGVIRAAYNHREDLEKVLDSILSQYPK